MNKEIKVKVREDHIFDGEPENSSCCAIALACEDVLTRLDMWDNVDQRFEMSVDADAYIVIKDKSSGEFIYEMLMEEEDRNFCSDFIHRFDNQHEYYDNQEEKDRDLKPYQFTARLVKEDDE